MLTALLRTGRRRAFGTTTTIEKTPLGTVTSYYDSQSGQHVRYSDAIQVHGLQLPAPGVKGLASVTLTTPIDVPAAVATHMYLTSNVAPHALALGVSCAASRREWDDAIAIAAAVTSLARPVKVTLLDPFAGNPYDVQLLGSLLADAGVTVLTLNTGSENDSDLLEEVFEALTWSDVVGLPMKQRIGLRSLDSDLVSFAAGSLAIKHYDVCFDGADAMTPAGLTDVLADAGLPHSLQL
ncbi:hypothetical protein SPRG_17120 [Saprolegnia parasitica CBS 223.65]|uniref:Uncharacterized protein n=1 Tax=Saprolegnia parasitica (strain CBS 223.65) TaxID=695850 RepID=A0A067BSY0_SAPPC|nr:hypothetical protein SPRG_17120 [Saprolegnia parasitica CBS 223.65]KDO17396.1 hypothetical protein SPRG_17120 [Saprolegnia parasitica CBS 223.65]|eukprot:XP_012211895.1 hypothetical protein SPRG_17120 [Saprolegnia parasitica CBS 223.65]